MKKIIRRIDKLPSKDKSEILSALSAMIKKHGFNNVRLAVSHFFKNQVEREKKNAKIAELKKEIKALSKK